MGVGVRVDLCGDRGSSRRNCFFQSSSEPFHFFERGFGVLRRGKDTVFECTLGGVVATVGQT